MLILKYIFVTKDVTKDVSADNLKDVIGRLIVEEHVSFQFAESDAFLSLINLLNPKAIPNVPKVDTMIVHVMTKYFEVRTKLKDVICNVKKISLTCDVWTSPNSKSILAVTGHWITNDWVLQDVLLDAIEINGKHSGENIAKHLIKIIDFYGIRDNIFCVTADNATNNRTMALYLHEFMPQFPTSQHLLGCVGHAFNLVAKAGLSVIDKPTEAYFIEIGLDNDEPSELSEVEDDEGTDDDAASSLPILHRIRKIINSIRCSPQNRQKFVEMHKISQQPGVPQPQRASRYAPSSTAA